jgi:hypothetical protein
MKVIQNKLSQFITYKLNEQIVPETKKIHVIWNNRHYKAFMQPNSEKMARKLKGDLELGCQQWILDDLNS